MKNNLVPLIMFFITSILSLICLTIFNSRFMLHEMDKYDYYDKTYKSLCNYLENNSIEYDLKQSDLENDIKKYVKNRYKEYFIHNKIESSTNTDSIYLDYVKFKNILKKYNMHLIIYIVFFITILLVIITGNLFIKTKDKHDIKTIFLYSSILLIIAYGIIYFTFNVNNDFLNYVVNDAIHYILGYAIILLDIVFIIKLKIFKN